MSWGLPQILLVVVVAILLFGRGKISELMGDVAKGIKSFKKGISEEDAKSEAAKSIDNEAAKTAHVHNQEKTGTS